MKTQSPITGIHSFSKDKNQRTLKLAMRTSTVTPRNCFLGRSLHKVTFAGHFGMYLNIAILSTKAEALQNHPAEMDP